MKFKKYLILLILPLLILVGGCKDKSLEKIAKDLDTYTLDIVYNPDNTLNVKQSIEYTNKTGDTLEVIKFHLYPRSFREDSKCSVISNLNYNKCFYNGKSFGDIEITSLAHNHTPLEIMLGGNDQDILEVHLVSPLHHNDQAIISMEYTVTIPNINHRFGYGENAINLGNFYPVACVYEDGAFVIDSYHYNGDPFYSNVANYNISITLDKALTLASTGNVISTTNHNTTTQYNISALAVRDFAIVISDKFKIVSDNIDNVTVNYYYYNNQYPNECLQAGIDSISTFNRLFGDYPYSTLNIVETNFVHGGMEYPNLVMISDTIDVQSDYINVIIHEIAHQWWYGVVGNNQFQYGWLDEGLTEYSTLLFYDNNPEYNINTDELVKNTTNSFVTFVDVYNQVFGKADTTMNRALNEYNNESEYVYIAYVKGMLLFNNLDEILGREQFIKGLQNYYNNNKFQIATPNTLINSLESATGNELSAIIESWINGKVKIIAIN